MNWNNVTQSKEVKDLIKQREAINDKIRLIDETALINYELEALNIPPVSKRLLTDVTVEYDHPTGLIKGKLEYDDDDEYLVLNYKGGTVHRPYLDKCNVC
jgi:hypothetical protein